MNSLKIGKKTLKVEGTHVNITRNKVTVDGVELDVKPDHCIEVRFKGNLASLTVAGNCTINGDVKGTCNVGKNLVCNDINKHANVKGNINCRKVGGNIKADGYVCYTKCK